VEVAAARYRVKSAEADVRGARAGLAALNVRPGSQWCVFTVENKGRARLQEIQIAHRNASEVEVLSGLHEGELVVRHPPNELGDEARVSLSQR